MFMKTKKIGFRIYLYNPISIDEGVREITEDGKEEKESEKKGPAYIQVTYNRKNTQFKLDYKDLTEKEFKSPKVQSALLEEQEFIRKVIETEIMILGDKFSLKGLGKRINNYKRTVYHGLFRNINSRLSNEIETVLKYMDEEDKELTGKENFFGVGILGFELNSSFVDDIKAITAIEHFDSVESIGRILLSKEIFEMFFDSIIKDDITSVNKLTGSYYSDLGINEMIILDWFQKFMDINKFSDDRKQDIKRINSILMDFVNN